VSYPRFLSPTSLEDALALLGATPHCQVLAGGTDLMVQLHARMVHPTALLDVWSLGALKGIDVVDGALEIGAAEPYAAIIRSAIVARSMPVLAEAARTIGAAQIQNRGTIGGNLATASPAGDTIPVLLAADATVVTDRRSIPVAEFYAGYRTTVLAPDELIVRIRFPLDGRRIAFRKVGTRRAQAISKVVLAVCRDPARIAIGSVAEIPLRAPTAEAALGRGDVPGTVEAVTQDIRPIDDVRSTAVYRRTVTRNVLRQLLSD
jgi:CO/xanthine dehydrogenase FAD-binding subunit